MQSVEGLDQIDSGGTGGGSVEIQPAEKRGRGRPKLDVLGKIKRKANAADTKGRRRPVVDPSRARFGQSSGARSGTGAGTGEETILEVGAPVAPPPPAPRPPKETIDQLCEMLFIGHLMAAKTLKIDEMQLSKQESMELAAASANVARHYQWTAMSEKTKDWMLLVACGSMVYGPHLAAVKARVQAAKMAKMKPAGFDRPEPPPEVVQEPIIKDGPFNNG